MKLLLFFIFVLYSTPCLGQIPQDKLLHMGGCYAISATTSSVMYNITGNRKKSLIYGISTAVAIGSIKEIYDIKCGNSDWGDVGANVVGATLGAITVTIRF